MKMIRIINNNIKYDLLDVGYSNVPKALISLHSPKGHFIFGEKTMKMIRRLKNCKDKRGKIRQYGLFFCPHCNQEVEKEKGHGIRDKSCGCFRTKHKEGNTRLYGIWKCMKARCINPNDPAYKNYGGRGITICNEWIDYIPFRDWANTNDYQKNLTIDRIDNDGNYEPDNCQFITREKNAQKRQNLKLNINLARKIREIYKTEKYTQKQLGTKYQVNQSTIHLIVKNKIWKED